MLPKIGDTVIYIQPAHEEPHGGQREHPARVVGYGTTSYEGLLDVEVMFGELAVPEGAPFPEDYAARQIVKREVGPAGADIGNGTWRPQTPDAEGSPPPGDEATNTTQDATG